LTATTKSTPAGAGVVASNWSWLDRRTEVFNGAAPAVSAAHAIVLTAGRVGNRNFRHAGFLPPAVAGEADSPIA